MGQLVEQVGNFKYLGTKLIEDGSSMEDVRMRIGMAKNAFSQRTELLSRRMSRNVKKKIVKTVIWPIALYGCETWTLRIDEIRKLNTLELWLWRKMEGVSWRDHRKNEGVLNVVQEGVCMVETIIKRKKRWIGHVLRGGGLMRDVAHTEK